MTHRRAPHRVAVLAIAPVVGFDMAIPMQTLGIAAYDDGSPVYDVELVGLDLEPVPTLSGYSVTPSRGPEALAEAETVIVPGTTVEGPRRHGVLSPELADALARIRPGTRMVSICTGAFVLAAAGYFDGRRAATHWHKADDFRRLYPEVELDANVLFIDEGDVLSSAGLSAGVDLCLHLVRTDAGAEAANAVARYCVVPPWRDGGQAQFIEHALPAADSASTSAVREWMLRHLDEPLTVQQLAEQARMSPRTFTRHFRAQTGRSPGAWLAEQRVQLARRLLETTDLPVDTVGARSGLGSGANLRLHLRNAIGLSPAAYRRAHRLIS